MKNIFLKIISLYKEYLSPILVLVIGGGCRFSPTCSDFATLAIKKHGTWRGIVVALKRILRCQPFGGHGVHLP